MSAKSPAAAKAAASQAKHVAKFAKYTVQPTGIWARLNRLFAVDPERSTGIPMNPQYRNPPPGSNDPMKYDDVVTVPAADLAENPYWKRDMRRRYPMLSTVKQGDVVALLTVGSKAAPKDDVLQLGDAGAKQLVAVQKEGKKKGLAAYFEKEKNVAAAVLGPNGLPPFPTSTTRLKAGSKPPYTLIPESEQTYGSDYPCRVFE